MTVIFCNLANFLLVLTGTVGARLVSVGDLNRKMGVLWSPIHE